MIRRQAGIGTKIGCHGFQATGIRNYLQNGGRAANGRSRRAPVRRGSLAQGIASLTPTSRPDGHLPLQVPVLLFTESSAPHFLSLVLKIRADFGPIAGLRANYSQASLKIQISLLILAHVDDHVATSSGPVADHLQH